MTPAETAPAVRPGISAAMLARAGVRRVTADEARELCGLAESGLWIPFRTPTGEPIMDTGDRFPEPRPYGRLRLDTARPGHKYHSWAGCCQHVFIPPGLADALAANGGDLHIIEGEFKALALADAGFAAIGLAGFYCHARPHGAGSDTDAPLLPGIETLLGELKPVRLLFTGDNDTAINYQFSDAAAKLARDAGVPVVLPRIPWNGPGKGADDCRAALGIAEFPAWWRDRVAAAIPVIAGRCREETMLAILEPEIPVIAANPGDTVKTCERLAELVGKVKGNPLVAEKITALVCDMFGGREKLKDAVEKQTAARKPSAKTVGAASRATVSPGDAAQTLILLMQGERMEAHVSPIDAAAAGLPYATTDAGFAERLAFHVKEKAFFHAGRGRWFFWNGARWQEACKEIEGYAVETARLIKKEVAAYPPGDRGDTAARDNAEKLLKFAFSCESLGRITAAIKLAASVRGMAKQADELDADPMLLCCGNGTLNLKTGELYPHRKSDYLTKGTPVEYDPMASDHLFEKFMANATGGDAAFEAYLRRGAGYSLTGDISEKCLFFLYNVDTDTGKTTFLEALRTVSGEYAAVINFELLCGDGGAHSNPKYDLAKLAGARFVSCSEIKRGQRLAADTVKRCTGGDSFPVRDCGEKSFVLKPVFKLWLAANDPPSCPDDDAALWNRMRRVPFGHRVPKEKRDPAVLKSLTTPGHPAARAFLVWAVRGAIEWAAHGLGTCPAVEKSTADYQEESDPLQNFFADCCRFAPEVWTESGTVRHAYEEWATTEGVNPKYRMSPKAFAGRLAAKGCKSFKRNRERAWQGIEVIEHENSPSGRMGRIEQEKGEVSRKETFLRDLPLKTVLSVPSVTFPHETAQQPAFAGGGF